MSVAEQLSQVPSARLPQNFGVAEGWLLPGPACCLPPGEEASSPTGKERGNKDEDKQVEGFLGVLLSSSPTSSTSLSHRDLMSFHYVDIILGVTKELQVDDQS